MSFMPYTGRLRPALRRQPLALAVALACLSSPALAEDAQQLPTVVVSDSALGAVTEGTDSYTTGETASATKLKLSLRETPQSVSVVTRTRMDDFGLDNANKVLASTPGVNVEEVETDRTYYTARGFDISNFLVDGVGLPFAYGNVVGDIDTVIYDRIEVLRGANALMMGSGEPSATVNFVLKRPTESLQAGVNLGLGSWDNHRAEADLSGPLNSSGTLRGRVVAAYQDKASHLDRYFLEKSVFLGVLEAELEGGMTVTAGHSWQKNGANSPLWGALPLYRTDGSFTDYKRSTSTASDWSYWNGEFSRSFLEFAQDMGGDWQAKLSLAQLKKTTRSKLFYVYGTPNPTTPGSDLFSYPSRYDYDDEHYVADLHATGPFQLLGRQHELVLGFDFNKSQIADQSLYGQGIGTEIPPLESWNGQYPEPAFNAAVAGSSWDDEQRSLYATTRLSLADRLSAIVGARLSTLHSDGMSYGTAKSNGQSDVLTPYTALTLDLGEQHSLYASHTEVFKPQTEQDVNRSRLDPVEGTNQELGFKSEWLDKKLNTSLAVFRTEQDNVAEAAGTHSGGFVFYRGADGVSSKGFELEASGMVLPGLEVVAGFTQLKVEDADGEEFKTYTPKKLLKLSASYRLLDKLKVGASLNWQDDIHLAVGTASTGANAGQPIVLRQDAYALLDLMARYDFTPNFSATVNLNNVTDEKYLKSLYWSQAYYGAPTHAMLTLGWKY